VVVVAVVVAAAAVAAAASNSRWLGGVTGQLSLPSFQGG